MPSADGLSRLGSGVKGLLVRLRPGGVRKSRDEGAQGDQKATAGKAITTRQAAPRPRPEGTHGKGARSSWLENLLHQALTFDGLMAVLLAIMLFYPPFFRGLFFENELLPTHMLTAVVFALFAFYKLERRELVFFERPLDYAVFILLGLYVTSSIDAWNYGNAVEAVLKMADYTAIYWLLAYSVRSLSAVRGYLGVLLASGAGVSLLGLGAAIGTFHYNDAFVQGRIYGSLQYPNSTAAFLTAINLFGLYLWDESRNKVMGVLLAVANFLIFLTILGTQSRGALLVYPVVLVIMLIGLSKQQRWRVLGCFIVQLVASLAAYSGVMSHTGGKTQLLGWLWVLGGAVLTSLIYLAWQYIAESRRRRAATPGRRLQPWVVPTAAVLVVAVLAAAGLGLWHERRDVAAIAAKADPQALVARLKTISWSDPNFQERLVMSSDALKIMIASPVNALLGTGGGGWNATYHMVQPYPYFSTETHDHFAQVGVETGFPGLLDFLLIWGFLIAAGWNLYRFAGPGGKKAKGTGAVPATTWVILSSAVALGIHSALDFNLSLGAVAILLWGLFGLVRGLDRLYGPETAAIDAAAEAAATQSRRERNHHKKNERTTWQMPSAVKGIIVGCLAVVVFFGALDLILGTQYGEAANAAAQGNNLQQAISDYEQAVRHDYLDTDYRSALTQSYLEQIQNDEKSQSASSSQNDDTDLLDKAENVMSIAVRESRGDSTLRMLDAQVLFQTDQVDQGLQQLEEANKLMPLDKSTYEALADGYFVAGRFYLEQSSDAPQGTSAQDVQEVKQKGQNDLELALGVPKRIQDRMAGVSKDILKLWTERGDPLLEVTPPVDQYAGMAAVLLGNYREADGYLQPTLSDSSLKTTSELWEGISLQQQGMTSQGQQMIGEATKSDPSLTQELAKIKALLPK
jgi:tetratricopeptide (TPR) repeat protein/uncharacterized membrane protein YidH (DUF202 family)